MRLRKLIDDDSAVSPVIGVILMVAITVILAAVIASFVLGLGPSEAAPSAQFEFEEVSSSSLTNIGGSGTQTVEIKHVSGDKIEAQYLSISGDVNADWAPTAYSGSSEIGSGDGVAVDASNDWSLSVVWEKDDQSSELASQEA
jgi:flagellin-like protein